MVGGAIAYEVGDASARVFFHPVSIMIVFGGILCVAMISFPLKELLRIFQRTYFAIRFPRDDFATTMRDIVRVGIRMNKDVMFLEKSKLEIKNAMLREAMEYLTMGFKSEDIKRFLEAKREQNESDFNQCIVLYMGISKMGPAFGLLGTLVGLIILLYYHMGAGNLDKVASSMGVALTATLYGVGLSNLVFGPLAEYMGYVAERGELQDKLVIEGAVLIKERRHPIYLVQALKAHLPRDYYREIDAMVREEVQSGKVVTEEIGIDDRRIA
jgi:chemotaxis protein MotA